MRDWLSKSTVVGSILPQTLIFTITVMVINMNELCKVVHINILAVCSSLLNSRFSSEALGYVHKFLLRLLVKMGMNPVPQ